MASPVVRVPASSANIGPGFDALGIALTLDAQVGIVDASSAAPRPVDDRHPAAVAFARGGGTGRVWVRAPIPSGRGLGFSAAMHVGGLLVAFVQRTGRAPETPDEEAAVLDAAIELEGHPDNAAAAMRGGAVAAAGGRVVSIPLAIAPAVVVWVPSGSTSTRASRARLPDVVRRDDAVFNVGRTALLVAALAAGDISALREATADRLHQPARLAAAPASAAALDAALVAGAWCAWLSGSGPTVAAMCDPAAADAIAAALPAGARTMTLAIQPRGASILGDAP